MTKIVNLVKSFTADESGEVGAEYAILLVLISLALVTVITLFSDAIKGAFDQAAGVINGATGGS